MQDQEIIRAIEAKEQAFEAVRQMMHMENITVLTSNMGTHLGMWVGWINEEGHAEVRQFSWTREHPGRDGTRLQWIYDAFFEYGRLKKKIENTTWSEEDQENADVIIQN